MMEINVNDANFEAEVIRSAEPVLVDFWAEWCGPCRMIGPVIEEIAKEYQGRLKVCKVNVEEAPLAASTYGIISIPAIMLFKGGNIVQKVVGAVPKGSLVAMINSNI
jgi:thioredoxin 1